MNIPRIAFISGHTFGAAALNGILSSASYRNNKIIISFVLGLHPKHALQTVGYYDLGEIAFKNDFEFAHFSKIKNNYVLEYIKERPFDYLLVIGLSQIIPKEILSLPSLFNNSDIRNSQKYGCIGMHPTLLPVGRGRAPLPWTILKKILSTGVTVFILDEEADNGGIIMQKGFTINNTVSVDDLFELNKIVHFELGQSIAKILENRHLIWTKQDESIATNWDKRSEADGWIDFNMNANEIMLLVRASRAPYSGAFFVYNGTIVFVEEVFISNDPSIKNTPGKIVHIDKNENLIIAAKDYCIHLIKYHYKYGKPKFKIGDIIFNGRRFLSE